MADHDLLVPVFNIPPVQTAGNHFGIDPRVYSGGRAFITQSFTEANVKVGSQWYISEEFTIPSNSSRWMLFETPEELRMLIKSRIISSNRGMVFRSFRASNAVMSGDLIEPLNFHDDLNDDPEINSNMTVCYDPTGDVNDHGRRIDVVRFSTGQGVSQGGGMLEQVGVERVLTKGMKYILQFQNLENSTANIIFSLTWFEGNLSTETV